jgi:hypothetical protein
MCSLLPVQRQVQGFEKGFYKFLYIALGLIIQNREIYVSQSSAIDALNVN